MRSIPQPGAHHPRTRIEQLPVWALRKAVWGEKILGRSHPRPHMRVRATIARARRRQNQKPPNPATTISTFNRTLNRARRAAQTSPTTTQTITFARVHSPRPRPNRGQRARDLFPENSTSDNLRGSDANEIKCGCVAAEQSKLAPVARASRRRCIPKASTHSKPDRFCTLLTGEVHPRQASYASQKRPAADRDGVG